MVAYQHLPNLDERRVDENALDVITKLSGPLMLHFSIIESELSHWTAILYPRVVNEYKELGFNSQKFPFIISKKMDFIQEHSDKINEIQDFCKEITGIFDIIRQINNLRNSIAHHSL